mmetsp:Transcript_17289/g.34883  ORF Transcript_17289/g.34883 Transcript_17289/m.34883 type:complete len:221 (-) Transcript_17289:137-799(-)
MLVLFSAEVPVSEISQPRKDVLHFVHAGIDERRHDRDLGMLSEQSLDALRVRNHIHKGDPLLRNARLNKSVDGQAGAASGGEHGVEKEHVPPRDVPRELFVRHVSLFLQVILIALDQYLPNPHPFGYGAKTRHHAISGTHYRHPHDTLAELEAVEWHIAWRHDDRRNEREFRESLLNEQPNDPVGIEHEVIPGGTLVSNDRVQSQCLGIEREDVDVRILC